MAASILPMLQVGVAATIIIGALHSAWRGTLREMMQNIRRIEPIEEKVECVDEKQDDISDALVALSHAQANDGVEPDPEAMERDLRDEETGPSRYTRDGFYRGDRAATEDEEEDPGAKNRERDRGPTLGPERDEP